MSTVDRALGILRLFTIERPEWSVEEAARAIGSPTSTVYRDFRSLTEAGLIVNFTAGRYVIGPAIVQLDYQTRRLDPLIVAAQPVLDELAGESERDVVVLLCRIYRLTVMCVDQRANTANHRALSYERGRPMPLYRGAPSKIILAHLPRRVLQRCYEQDGAVIADAGLGQDWREFLDTLRGLRRARCSVTAGDLDRGVLGVAAPVFGPEGEIMASISLVVEAAEADTRMTKDLCERAIAGAQTLTDRLKARANG